MTRQDKAGMGDVTLFDLTGMVAIVTGGAQGLGFAIADAFVNHGAAAVICDSNSAAAKRLSCANRYRKH